MSEDLAGALQQVYHDMLMEISASMDQMCRTRAVLPRRALLRRHRLTRQIIMAEESWVSIYRNKTRAARNKPPA